MSIDPLALFSIQFTFVLIAYALAAHWYLCLGSLRCRRPSPWCHSSGSTCSASWGVDPRAGIGRPVVPAEFRELVGYGDMITGALALIALILLRVRGARALWFVWLFVIFGLADTVNAVIQSMRFSVFDEPLGLNWVIVTAYVPALLVSTYLIFVVLLRSRSTVSE